MSRFSIIEVDAIDPKKPLTSAEKEVKRKEAIQLLAKRFNCQIDPETGHLINEKIHMGGVSMELTELGISFHIVTAPLGAPVR